MLYGLNYKKKCKYYLENTIPMESKIILSEDIFENILSKRIENQKKNEGRKKTRNAIYAIQIQSS